MLKVGFYEKEITPPLGLSMPGGLGHRFTKGVWERVYAKAIAIELDGEEVILISLDAISTTTPTCKNVIERIRKYVDIPEANIVISATHSHTSMPVHREKYGEFDTPDEAYFDVTERLIADTAILAHGRLTPATAKYNTSEEKGLGFNRTYYLKDGTIRTNPGWQNPDIIKPFGLVNETFNTIFFIDESGKPLGAIANFSCHNCCTGRSDMISSDYAGVLSDGLRKEFGADFVTVFLLGTAGNINHVDNFREKEIYERPRHYDIGEALSRAAIEHLKDAKPLEIDVLKTTKNCIPLGKQHISDEQIEECKRLMQRKINVGFVNISHPESEEFKRRRALSLLNIANMPEPVEYCVQTVRLGDCLIFALCGEVYCEYGFAISEKSPAKLNIFATLSNGYTGSYVPVPEARGTNIYEANVTSACLEDYAGDKIVAEAVKQAKDIMK